VFQPLLDRHLDGKDNHVRVVVVQQLNRTGLVVCLGDPLGLGSWRGGQAQATPGPTASLDECG
jgi:hypothetical protein